ncbi:hypothetical protein TB2_026963 [Malus domestica]|uniref:protein DWD HYPERSENSITIVE TO UV-B 1-like isoform X1 n=2 Tax=Malus domestica TaxID=3750 RepID=UPI0010AA0427|nr:uncharacterized protein LOC114820875 isoform X1 [Malus domestica]
MNVSSLKARYLDSCQKHEVQPNSAILSWFSQAKIQSSNNEKCSIVISLDQLRDADILPLTNLLMSSDSADIDAVDIFLESNSDLGKENVKTLINAVNLKLRVIDLQDLALGNDFLWDLLQGCLACQVFNLRSINIQKLNMVGSFLQLHTLRLDFCTSLASLQKDCFSGMPNLMRLSMCETTIANLMATTGALSKLPSLVELRFQSCLCCKDTGACSNLQGQHNLQSEVQEKDEFLVSVCKLDLKNPAITLKYITHCRSPICFEKYYREYMISMLPGLEVLDNLPIGKTERELAMTTAEKYYEYLPYKRHHKESVVSVLHKREMGTNVIHYQRPFKPKQLHPYRNGQNFFLRSLCAAKIGSSMWPLLHPLSKFSHSFKTENKKLRPRQFEYHPSNPSLMVFGSLDGEVVVLNHENEKIVGYIPSVGRAMSSVLGLCWLNKNPSKLVAGSDNGSLKLFDINYMSREVSGSFCSSSAATFDDFEQLTSLHVNSTDDQLLASSYSKGLALYDLASGKRLQLFTNIHQEPINVSKFSHHSPYVFATSSFDHDVKMWDLRQNPMRPCYTASSSRGNVMVCFSPDDLYLLVSAVDNEVKQLLAADGRVHMNFEIAATGSSHNYTRSYYMNGRDYIISGSCDENIVRICCAQTGKRLRDVHLEDTESGNSIFVQSLRGDPFRHFHMSILATSTRPSSKWEIIKVNLLRSSCYSEEYSSGQCFHPSCCLGG